MESTATTAAAGTWSRQEYQPHRGRITLLRRRCDTHSGEEHQAAEHGCVQRAGCRQRTAWRTPSAALGPEQRPVHLHRLDPAQNPHGPYRIRLRNETAVQRPDATRYDERAHIIDRHARRSGDLERREHIRDDGCDSRHGSCPGQRGKTLADRLDDERGRPPFFRPVICGSLNSAQLWCSGFRTGKVDSTVSANVL